MNIPEKVKEIGFHFLHARFRCQNTTHAERLCSWVYSRLLPCPDRPRFIKAASDVCRKGSFGSWSLSANALQALVASMAERRHPRILEFGSGASTLFLQSYYGNAAVLDSFEHQQEFANKLRRRIVTQTTRIHLCELWQFDNEEFARIMRGDIGFPELYRLGRKAEDRLYSETRVRNAFYRVKEIASGYDAMILDGPHGNGRSIAFAVVRDFMTDPAYFLIDDCNHYEFIYYCSPFFRFNILHAELYPSKRWVLLEVRKR
jgi:hypothetical protein